MPDYTLSNAARLLDAFSREMGFVPQTARFITGEFNILIEGGDGLYSDESYLYCRDCAASTLERARTLLGEGAEEKHEIYTTDAWSEDIPSYCKCCGEILDFALSNEGVQEELAHYAENPSLNISAQEAFCIARILDAAEAVSDARSAATTLAAISLGHIAAGRIRGDLSSSQMNAS